MAHVQSSPRGAFGKERIEVGAQALSANSTALLVAGQIRVNGARYLGGNSTGYLLTPEATLPTTDGGDYKVTLVVTAGGTASLAVNTTGTTWKYTKMTSTINTT